MHPEPNLPSARPRQQIAIQNHNFKLNETVIGELGDDWDIRGELHITQRTRYSFASAGPFVIRRTLLP